MNLPQKGNKIYKLISTLKEGETMEKVIDSLVEIEERAARIIDGAASKKAELASEYDKKIKDFDSELSKKTNAELSKVKEKYDGELKEELDKLRKKYESNLNTTKKLYDEKHTVLAKDIVKSMIEE